MLIDSNAFNPLSNEYTLNSTKTVTSVGQFLATLYTFMFLLSHFKSNSSIIIIVCNIYFDFEINE